jgi:hypothetical protein
MRRWIRQLSLRKRIAARTSLSRFVRHSLGLKAPRGWGWLTNPKRALYNRVYYRSSTGCLVVLAIQAVGVVVAVAFAVVLATLLPG